jgi:excisionase family DNA binding protein
VSNDETVQAKRRLGDAREVAAIVGCSERTVYRLADAGKMPFGVKLGAMRRWDLNQIEQWIEDGCKPVRTNNRR